MELVKRITTNPEQCGGRPCIRGMRIRVVDVLEMLGSGMSEAEILTEFPYLEHDDILAAIQFAAYLAQHAQRREPLRLGHVLPDSGQQGPRGIGRNHANDQQLTTND